MKNLIQNLDKAFDNKARLGIMAVLTVNSSLSFNDLKDLLELTDGNLASHLKALETAEYLSASKRFIGRKPNTTYQITESGKEAFENHIEALEELIKQQKQ